jgi:hypothetical protein
VATAVLIFIFTIIQGSNYALCVKVARRRRRRRPSRMQYNDNAGEFALLTRQEVAYLSDGLPHLTNAQKSKLNYKIKKKLQIFEKVELPLLMKSGFELGSISLSIENNKDCHSLDPGSKFGLEKEPNEYPGPGACNTFTVRLRMNYPSYFHPTNR